jgi:hypothetical protein
MMKRLTMKLLVLAALVQLVPTAAQIAACAPDAQRLCLQHFGNHEAMRACMIEHKKQLSETCKAAFR